MKVEIKEIYKGIYSLTLVVDDTELLDEDAKRIVELKKDARKIYHYIDEIVGESRLKLI